MSWRAKLTSEDIKPVFVWGLGAFIVVASRAEITWGCHSGGGGAVYKYVLRVTWWINGCRT